MKKTPPSPPPSYNEAVPMQMTMPMPVPVDMPIMPGASSNTPVRLPPGFQHQMPPRPPKNCAPTAPNSAGKYVYHLNIQKIYTYIIIMNYLLNIYSKSSEFIYTSSN